jgi:hypothetical protein
MDGEICFKSSHTCNHSRISGINMKKPIKNFKNFHYQPMVHSIEFMVNYTKCEEFSYKKNGWKVCSRLVGFSNFPTYFYMRILLNYDYDMKKINTLIHISALSIWKYKKSKYNCIFIILSYIWSRNMTHAFMYLYF